MDEQLQRWLKPREAAIYCGYSLSQFKRFVAQYRIPKAGPAHNRFDRIDLDRWMKDSLCFIKDEFPGRETWTGTYGKVYDLFAGGKVLYKGIEYEDPQDRLEQIRTNREKGER